METTEQMDNLSTSLPGGVFNSTTNIEVPCDNIHTDNPANDAIWILTSTFIIFTMQSGKT